MKKRKTEEIGERLRQLRDNLHLSQAYVAEQIGVSRSALVRMENNQRHVTGEELLQLSRIYGVTTDYILGGDARLNHVAECFACSYQELTEADREEIKNVIKFKKRLRKKLQEIIGEIGNSNQE